MSSLVSLNRVQTESSCDGLALLVGLADCLGVAPVKDEYYSVC